MKNANLPNLNERLQRELDILWDNGALDEKKLETLRHEHLRTPYISVGLMQPCKGGITQDMA